MRYKAYKMRRLSVKSTSQAGSGHPTSCLSAADIMSVLFFYAMQFDPYEPKAPENDHFVLSKGHAAPLLYAAWKEVLEDEFSYDILNLRNFESVLEGHPTPRCPYVEAATGSLGQGLSIAAGMAMHDQRRHAGAYTYVLLGDSEMTEGSNWEAIEIAAHYKLDHLIAVVDANRLGQSTATIEGHNLQRYKQKFEAFGWRAIIVDGHDMWQIMQACNDARATEGQPVAIIAQTYKGRGVDADVKDAQGYHGKPFSQEELTEVLNRLEQAYAEDVRYQQEQRAIDMAPNIQTGMGSGAPRAQPVAHTPEPSYTDEDALPTRVAFGNALAAFGHQNPDIVSLDAEVKNSTYAQIFEKEHPDRFVQCYIAEQNMIGMGVGMYARGNIPVCSTFAAFMSRAHDQIRMAAIGRSALRLVGSHAGVSIGEDGPSQMGLEDIAMMRALHNSIVLYPCDAVSTHHLVGHMLQYDEGISYLRTTRMKTPIIYDNNDVFPLGEARTLRANEEDVACVVAAGITVFEALKAYEQLQQEGIMIRVVDCYCIKPFPEQRVIDAAHHASKRVMTVEDHYPEGGLGEATAHALADTDIALRVLAVDKMPRSGTPQELLSYVGIDAETIIARVKEMVQAADA